MSKQRILGGLGLIVVVLGLVAVAKIGPRNVLGMLRYDTRREGSRKVGDRAPGFELLSLDGTTRVQLGAPRYGRPLVLIFGSFT